MGACWRIHKHAAQTAGTGREVTSIVICHGSAAAQAEVFASGTTAHTLAKPERDVCGVPALFGTTRLCGRCREVVITYTDSDDKRLAAIVAALNADLLEFTQQHAFFSVAGGDIYFVDPIAIVYREAAIEQVEQIGIDWGPGLVLSRLEPGAEERRCRTEMNQHCVERPVR